MSATWCLLSGIDAVCINQSDVDERNQQVRLMRDIFHGAECVSAWLGEEEESSTLALDVIERWAVAYANHGTDIPAMLQTVGNPFHPLAWGAIRSLLSRPWWTRLWIYQEVVMAQRVILLCGHKSLDWNYLHQAYFPWHELLLLTSSAYVSIKDTGPIVNVMDNSYWVSLVFDRRKKVNNQSENMLNLMRSCIHRQSTDLRDRIFAVIGLAQDGSDFGGRTITILSKEFIQNLLGS